MILPNRPAGRRAARSNWDRIASAYDRVAGRTLAGWLADRLPLEGGRILDVGCGTGRWAMGVAGDRSLVVGVDFSRGMIARAEALRRQSGILRCRFLVGEAGALPFRSGVFDEVVSMASLKFWPNPLAGLDEIHRVLAPGGRARIVEADREAPFGAVRAFLMDRGLGSLSATAVGLLLRFFLRRKGLSRRVAGDLGRRSRFGGGREESLSASPFFCLDLRRRPEAAEPD